VGIRSRVAGAAVGVVIDRIAGEPPPRVHPVVGFGALMTTVERRCYADRRANGVAHAVVGVGCGFAVGLVLNRVLGRAAGTAAAVAAAAAGRMLGDEAHAVADRLRAGDLLGARTQVARLVGRDTSELDAHGVARAVIESVAENTVDAVTAPVVWALIGGAPAVLAHRAINTMDAMVGHRSARYERYGWASARLDDVVNWLPARLTAIAVAACRPRRAAAVLRAVRRDARRHPSPNGGIVEAAFAAALDVRLGGTNRYGDRVERRGVLHAAGALPAAADVGAAVDLSMRVTDLLTFAPLPALVRARRRWSVSRR
jgi:adenosylcobinamide-phosphate synthase